MISQIIIEIKFSQKYSFLCSMKWIDTHAHLYLPEFEADIDQVIERSKSNHISGIILPNIDAESIPAMLALVDKAPEIFCPALGLHPCSVKSGENLVEWEEHWNLLSTGKFCAIGETGIDLYWDKTTLHLQEKNFARHIKKALEYDLPLIIHVRNSFQEVFRVLDEHYDPKLKGVFHCFTGDRQEIEKVNSYKNFYFGIGGVITFKNSNLKHIIKQIPTEKILLETDAPYLTPTPYRGKRNESGYIPIIAESLSKYLEVSIEELSEITTGNAVRLFNLTVN